jgi:hypothetical protein
MQVTICTIEKCWGSFFRFAKKIWGQAWQTGVLTSLTSLAIENAIIFASPTSRGSKLYNWQFKISVHTIIEAAICQAMTPAETVRSFNDEINLPTTELSLDVFAKNLSEHATNLT